MKGGISYSFIDNFADPLISKNMDPISTQGGVAGAMIGRNIVAGIQQDNYSPTSIPGGTINSPLV
jgi:hypothetical protein